MAERKIPDRDGETYRCEPMRATEALELLADLTRLASQGTGRLPAILMGLEEQASGMEEGGLAVDAAGIAALGDILRVNSSADIRHLVERIVTAAEVRRPSGYGRINLDDDFSGRLEAIVPVAKFVLETNFRSFFLESVAPGLLSRILPAFQNRKSGASPQT